MAKRRELIWTGLSKLAVQLRKKSGLKSAAFAKCYSTDRAYRLLSPSPSLGEIAWNQRDLENFLKAYETGLSKRDLLAFKRAFAVASSLAKRPALLPDI